MKQISYTPRIFISHSAKDDPPAKQLIAKLEASIQQAGFDALLDWTAIAPGDDWPTVIEGWIWTCDAAVVLLSEKALLSPHVKHEITLLLERRKRNKSSFMLLPIFPEDLSKDTIDKSLKPLRFTDTEAILWSRRMMHEDEAASCTAVIDHVMKHLIHLRARVRYRHELEQLLYEALNRGCQDDTLLSDIAMILELGVIPLGARKDTTLMIARSLMDLNVRSGENHFEKLRQVIDMLQHSVRPDALQWIINAVTPFCWVNPQVAVQLPIIALSDSATRGVVWQRKWVLSEDMHLHRAYCCRKLMMVQIGDWSGIEKYDLDALLKALSDKVLFNKPGAATIDEVNAKITELQEAGIPVFLATPAETLDRTFAKKVLALWPKITLFLYSAQLSEAELLDWQREGFALLNPTLDARCEDLAAMKWGDLMQDYTKVDAQSIVRGKAFRVFSISQNG